ncbi:MAG: FAD-dependent thymidylate synthase, partial [Planctomycetaceae bacterium]
TTPFEMAELKFVVRVPMDCWRQWIRHRTASVNEYSTRYSLAIDAMQATADDGWRSQAATNRQGSGGPLPEADGHRFTRAEQDLQHLARKVYEDRLEAGIAREQARKDLPLSTYTEAYWKIDLHNLLHFLALRMDAHAQLEIRRYAETIGREIVAPLFPLVWEAFLDYRVEALRLTRLDQEVIRRLAARRGGTLPASHADFLATQDPSWRDLARCRERDECLDKLVNLGLVAPPETAS